LDPDQNGDPDQNAHLDPGTPKMQIQIRIQVPVEEYLFRLAKMYVLSRSRIPVPGPVDGGRSVIHLHSKVRVSFLTRYSFISASMFFIRNSLGSYETFLANSTHIRDDFYSGHLVTNAKSLTHF